MKKALPWIIALALAIVCLALIDKACGGPSAAYLKLKADYDLFRAEREADIANLQRQLAEVEADIEVKDADIASRDLTIATLKLRLVDQQVDEAELDAENARLRRDAQAAIDANPALQALISNYDLRLRNKDEQITTLAFTLKETETKVEDLRAIRRDLEVERDLWKKNYTDEHALRLNCEVLNRSLESQAGKSKKLNRWLAGGAAVLAAVAIAK